MKKRLFFLVTIFTISGYTQVSFEEGYYINNSNQKTNCLIKNMDWKNNPTAFEYKLSKNSQLESISIKQVKEFGIYNVSKYIRKTIKIDISSDNVRNLSNVRNPIFDERQLFLKVLLEGEANLYFYKNIKFKRYFFSTKNSEIQQLIYKKYTINDQLIKNNNRFKTQLWNNLKCSKIKKNRVENLEYKKNNLVNFFSEYNNCNSSKFVNFEKKLKKDLFNLSLRPRINNSSLTPSKFSSPVYSNIDFGSQLSFGFGVELEYILPFNKNKWTILLEPTYQSFKINKEFNSDYVSNGKLIGEVNYNSIEFPVSLRHYFFLNNKARIFLNFSYILFDTSYSKSTIEFKRSDNSSFDSLEIEDTPVNFSFGIGYKFSNYSLEMRYHTSKEISGNNNANWRWDYKSLSMIIGYTIF